jgi:DNA-directed RNA polymerase subunit beta
LEIFDLADEVKVSKSALKEIVGKKLAASVLKTWVEDFVDEDTGEVVSIERNEIIIDRETVIEDEHVHEISLILAQAQSWFTKKPKPV